MLFNHKKIVNSSNHKQFHRKQICSQKIPSQNKHIHRKWYKVKLSDSLKKIVKLQVGSVVISLLRQRMRKKKKLAKKRWHMAKKETE